MEEAKVVVLSGEKSKYLAESIIQELNDYQVNSKMIEVVRNVNPNGEKYFKLQINNVFDLVEKTSIYVSAIVDDEDILDVCRLGITLSQCGCRRKIFIISFLAYSCFDRAKQPGEVVTAKCTNQLLSTFGHFDDANIFILFDLHRTHLQHYFEGGLIHLEVSSEEMLTSAVASIVSSDVMMGSVDLGRTTTVSSIANSLQIPVAFVRPLELNDEKVEVIGDVVGKHVIIWTDMLQTGNLLMKSTDAYFDAGAVAVDCVVTHCAFFDDNDIQKVINSRIGKIFTTDSHPSSQKKLVKESSKFVVLGTAQLFSSYLIEMIPSSLNHYTPTI